jgi:hypothetical protein
MWRGEDTVRYLATFRDHSALCISPVDGVGRAAHGSDVQDLEVQLG